MNCKQCGEKIADNLAYCEQCSPIVGREILVNSGCEASSDEFASGLPGWDLVPPQMIVRRVKRSI